MGYNARLFPNWEEQEKTFSSIPTFCAPNDDISRVLCDRFWYCYSHSLMQQSFRLCPKSFHNTCVHESTRTHTHAHTLHLIPFEQTLISCDSKIALLPERSNERTTRAENCRCRPIISADYSCPYSATIIAFDQANGLSTRLKVNWTTTSTHRIDTRDPEAIRIYHVGARSNECLNAIFWTILVVAANCLPYQWIHSIIFSVIRLSSSEIRDSRRKCEKSEATARQWWSIGTLCIVQTSYRRWCQHR